MKHLNFYENLKEAQLRLRMTVVCYDGVPYSVQAITNHKPDGIFRVYLSPIGQEDTPAVLPNSIGNYSAEDPALGRYLDEWMTGNKTSLIIRKNIDSPLFNKFRPYSLGMCNYGTDIHYIERQPNRRTEQGLTRTMLESTNVSLTSNIPKFKGSNGCIVELYSSQFKACVLADHPSAEEVLFNLNDPKIENLAIAFHRRFALLRGPIGMLFLAYKTEVVGVLVNNDFSVVRLGAEFRHCREVIEDLKLFKTII